MARPSHGPWEAGLAAQPQWEQGTATQPPQPSSLIQTMRGLQAPAQPETMGRTPGCIAEKTAT